MRAHCCLLLLLLRCRSCSLDGWCWLLLLLPLVLLQVAPRDIAAAAGDSRNCNSNSSGGGEAAGACSPALLRQRSSLAEEGSMRAGPAPPQLPRGGSLFAADSPYDAPDPQECEYLEEYARLQQMQQR